MADLMKKVYSLQVILSLTFLFFSSFALSASFDCGKASTDVEKKICNSPSLSIMDEKLSEFFKPLKSRRTFQVIESDWLESERNSCESVECLEEAYVHQIQFLSPVTIAPRPTQKDIKLMLGDKAYTQFERSWKVVDLAWLPNEKGTVERFVISAETISGMLHVIVFEGHFDPAMVAYRGNLYEYVDRNDRPVLHTIAKDIGFDGALNLGSNDEGKRFAGILDGAFYYRQQLSKNQLRGMVYKLGSKLPPAESSLLFQQWPNTDENAVSGLTFGWGGDYGKLQAYYSHTKGYETIAPVGRPEVGWNIYSPIWSKSRPTFYFKNGNETIWRANVADKTLTKIAMASDGGMINNPTPVDINGREAVVYLNGYTLKMAISLDE
ncbi:lysozyme inhibitor LprI family protein [Pseudomonas sp. BW7P1]|uniref:lysozyme inhibitor LprI family protein n=1 Tax=Pseudomonas TaxID=286 RepID=UPI0021AE1B8E|nr:hypothetical protein [Pseudomonas sp. BW7P1]UWI61866.1 hypothetical protein NWV16_00260 [Pseudomonas sp. BW7P1]